MRSTSVFIIQNSEEVGFGLLGTQLWDAGAKLEVVRGWSAPDAVERIDNVRHAIQANSPSKPDAVVVLGGQMAADDDEHFPWLPATRALMKTCVETNERCLGICLGAQLLALALGGTVESPGKHGPEDGLIQVNWCGFTIGHNNAGDVLSSIEFAFADHLDAITQLPPNVSVLATSFVGYPQILSVANTIGVQFHPEITPEAAHAWTWGRYGVDGKKIARDVTIRKDELALTCQALTDWLVER